LRVRALIGFAVALGGCPRAHRVDPSFDAGRDASVLDADSDAALDAALDASRDASARDAGVREDATIDDARVATDAGLGPPCPDAPSAPILWPLDDDERWTFPEEVFLALGDGLFALSHELAFEGHVGPLRVRAHSGDPSCLFDVLYEVRPTYSPAARNAGTYAIDADDAHLTRFATEVEIEPGEGSIAPRFTNPNRALGRPSRGTGDVVCLGEGGRATLRFDAPIRDGEGPDFAVFENAFDDHFLELAYVEVTSDGRNFARFDVAFRGPPGTSETRANDPTTLGGFAGTFRAGFGTPFDLAALRAQPEVRAGQVDLDAIVAIRVVDVIGDGRERDAFGRTIWDPTSTRGTPGFDLDAVGVLEGVAPSP
jgi:hypothetical protein